MRRKTQSSANDVQPGKQVVTVVPRNHGSGRKKSAPGRDLVPQRNTPRGGKGQLAQLNPQNVIGLLQQAVKNKSGIEVLERLTALQVQAEERIAKQLFYEAMARFQKYCPVIPKRTEARDDNGKLLYKYAEMDAIVLSAAPLAAQEGFSWIIKTPNQTLEEVEVLIEVHHCAGHVEVSTLKMPVSGTRMMSAGQKIAATETLAKRHVYCNAFGITTGYQDKDGRFGVGQADNGAKAQPQTQKPAPETLPQTPATADVEKLLPLMTWLPEKTAAAYRKQAKGFAEKKDDKSMRGLMQSLSRQIAMKGRQKT